MDNITYNSIKNELLDVINSRLNDFNIEMTNKIESFKNDMTELFNNRIIDYATTSNHNFDEAKSKIDETLNIIKSDFDKSISKFDKASEILNFGNLNINSDSIISLFSAQTNSDNAIKQLSGSVFTIKDNIKKIENKQDDFIFNLSGVLFNSGFTLDFSGSMMTILRNEMNSLYESNYGNINSRLNNFENTLSGFGGTLSGINTSINTLSGRMDNFITSGYLEDKKFICEDNLNKFDIVTDESLTKTLSGYTTTEQVTGMIKFHIPDSLE